MPYYRMVYPTYLYLSLSKHALRTAPNDCPIRAPRHCPGFRAARDDAPCLLDSGDLVVLSFVLIDGKRSYVHHGPRRISVATLQHDIYLVHAVQDFEAECQDPDLCASLARVCVIPVRADGTSASPADFPIESRPLECLGVLVVR
jgi:hypothetical protein